MRFLIILALLVSITAKARNIVHIGDSHSAGVFGFEMSKLLNANSSITSASYGSCGAVARWYFTGQATKCGYFHHDENGNRDRGTKIETPLLENITKNFTPDIAIIQFAGNYMGYSNKFIKQDTLKMAQYFIDRGATCYWVGAPDSRTKRERRAEVKKIIQANIGNLCHFIDSTLYTKYPATGGDGIHYWGTEGSKIARSWAKNVIDIVNAK
jgi:hypothetical protein